MNEDILQLGGRVALVTGAGQGVGRQGRRQGDALNALPAFCQKDGRGAGQGQKDDDRQEGNVGVEKHTCLHLL